MRSNLGRKPWSEAVVSKADGRGRATFNCALGCVKRQSSPIEPSDYMGSLQHDTPCSPRPRKRGALHGLSAQ
jgi:hypothetical protein